MFDPKKNTSETLARYFGDEDELNTLNINLAQLHISRSRRRGVTRGLPGSLRKVRKLRLHQEDSEE